MNRPCHGALKRKQGKVTYSLLFPNNLVKVSGMYPRACYNISRAEQVMSFCAQTIYVWYDKSTVLRKNKCVLSKGIKLGLSVAILGTKLQTQENTFSTHTKSVCLGTYNVCLMPSMLRCVQREAMTRTSSSKP